MNGTVVSFQSQLGSSKELFTGTADLVEAILAVDESKDDMVDAKRCIDSSYSCHIPVIGRYASTVASKTELFAFLPSSLLALS